MLDSERKFKIKVMSGWTIFEILLTSAVVLIRIYRVLHGKEIVQYFENCKRHEVDQSHSKKHLQSSTRVSLPLFLHDFLRKLFLWLYSIN